MPKKLTHVVVETTLHRKLKILSAQIGVPMIDLTHEALELIITKYKPKHTEAVNES